MIVFFRLQYLPYEDTFGAELGMQTGKLISYWTTPSSPVVQILLLKRLNKYQDCYQFLKCVLANPKCPHKQNYTFPSPQKSVGLEGCDSAYTALSESRAIRLYKHFICPMHTYTTFIADYITCLHFRNCALIKLCLLKCLQFPLMKGYLWSETL